MHNECASICMWDLDAEEERHRLVDGIWNEMLQMNSQHTLAIENNECKNKTKASQNNVMQMIMERKLKIIWAHL